MVAARGQGRSWAGARQIGRVTHRARGKRWQALTAQSCSQSNGLAVNKRKEKGGHDRHVRLLLGQVKRSCPSCGPSEPGGEEEGGEETLFLFSCSPGAGGVLGVGVVLRIKEPGQDGWVGVPPDPCFPVLPPRWSTSSHSSQSQNVVALGQTCLLPPSVRRRGRVERICHQLSPSLESRVPGSDPGREPPF